MMSEGADFLDPARYEMFAVTWCRVTSKKRAAALTSVIRGIG